MVNKKMKGGEKLDTSDLHILPVTESKTTTRERQTINTIIDNENSVNSANSILGESKPLQKGGTAQTGKEGKVEMDYGALKGLEGTAIQAVQDANQIVAHASNDDNVGTIKTSSGYVSADKIYSGGLRKTKRRKRRRKRRKSKRRRKRRKSKRRRKRRKSLFKKRRTKKKRTKKRRKRRKSKRR
jgi:hypothetical protein